MKPAPDYDELTVGDVKDRVRDNELGPAAVLAYERDNKDRVTLTRWLEERAPPLGDGDADADPEPESDADASSATQPSPADAPSAADDADDGHETVTVASQRLGSIAGMHFDAAYETRVVARTPRVEEAISDGDLRVIDD